MARISEYGDVICDLQTSDPYCDNYTTTPGVTDQNQEICSIANNPHNPGMWVMLRGGETRTSVIVTTDDGLTWQYENRAPLSTMGKIRDEHDDILRYLRRSSVRDHSKGELPIFVKYNNGLPRGLDWLY